MSWSGDAAISQPVFVVVFSESPDAVLLELVVETGMLICPPVGQNAHIEARVSARGGIMGGSGDVFDDFVLKYQ